MSALNDSCGVLPQSEHCSAYAVPEVVAKKNCDKSERLTAALPKAVRISVAAVLLVAALLKAHGVITDPLKGELLGIPTAVQVIAFEVELLLTAWLFSGRLQRLALGSTALFFAIAAGVAAKQVLDREVSCGCFGAVDVNPLITLFLDLTLFVALITVILKQRKQAYQAPAYASEARIVLKYALILLAFLVVASTFGFFDVLSMVRTLRGEWVALEPRVLYLGEVSLGVSKSGYVEIVNHGSESVTVMGGNADCGCVVGEDLPVSVAPHSRSIIKLTFLPRKKAGTFRQRFALFTNHPGQPLLYGGIVISVATSQNAENPNKVVPKATKEAP